MIGANLTDADLSKARVIAALNNATLVRTKLEGTNFGADRGNQPMGLMFTNLTDADLSGADLSGSNLRKASLVRANLTDANLAGADVSDANFDQAIVAGVRGKATVVGLATARNMPNDW